MSDMCSYPNCEISSSVSMLLLNILPDWGLPPCLFSIYIPYDSWRRNLRVSNSNSMCTETDVQQRRSRKTSLTPQSPPIISHYTPIPSHSTLLDFGRPIRWAAPISVAKPISLVLMTWLKGWFEGWKVCFQLVVYCWYLWMKVFEGGRLPQRFSAGTGLALLTNFMVSSWGIGFSPQFVLRRLACSLLNNTVLFGREAVQDLAIKGGCIMWQGSTTDHGAAVLSHTITVPQTLKCGHNAEEVIRWKDHQGKPEPQKRCRLIPLPLLQIPLISLFGLCILSIYYHHDFYHNRS